MSMSETLVLCGGGFKSQVAAATLGQMARPDLLYVRDGRPGEAKNLAAFNAICDHVQARRREQIELPHLLTQQGEVMTLTPLGGLQLISAAADYATRLGSQRLVWGVRAGEDFDKLSQITEAIIMVEHLARAAGATLRVQTPLLEMTGEEIVEVGEQLGVPWQLSRDCWLDGEQPCGRCVGCDEREHAFAKLSRERPDNAPRRRPGETVGPGRA